MTSRTRVVTTGARGPRGYTGADNIEVSSLLGVNAYDANMGTFTGSTISDNGTAKEALQELETAVEAAQSTDLTVLNPNSDFLVWADSSAIPYGWTSTVIDGSSARAKVSGIAGGNAVEEVVADADDDIGFRSSGGMPLALGLGPVSFVMRFSVTLVAGALDGAVVRVEARDASQTIQEYRQFELYDLKDISGVAPGSGTVGKTYHFVVPVVFTDADIDRYVLFAYSNRSTVSPRAAKTLRWNYFKACAPGDPLSAFKTPQLYGAVGDGVADDTTAWASFQAATGPKYIPAGSYLVNGETLTFEHGCFGNGNVTTNLTSGQLAQITTGNQNFSASKAKLVFTADYDDADILPSIYVSTLIEDDSGEAAAAKVAGIYSYIEQTGTDTNQYPKAIAGTAVNAAAGNNDATGVVGYAYKLDVTDGIGDVAGAGGVAWQYSSEAGLVVGGEFACHQRVSGTSSSASAGSGNNSINLHLTSNSDGARGWAAMSVDSQGLNSGKYGYWNGIVISRSSFGAGAEGMGQTGTVGINFGNNTTTGPEKALYLGNAEYHLWRSTTAATRIHGSTLDFERVSDGAPGMRLITPSGSFQGGYFGAYAGSTGPDGTTSVQARGAFSVDSSGYVTLISYNQSTGAVVANIGVSPNSNAFIPRGSSVGSITVGASAARIGQVFTTIAEDVSSDERLKTDIQSYPDALLDAWGDVEHVIYHLKADKKKQGKAARFRMGLIAQQVLAACAARGMTEKEVMAFGFISLNKWEAQPEVTSTERVLKKHAVHEQVLVRPEVREKIWKRPPSYERILVKPEVREKILIKPAVIENGKVVEPAVHEFGEVLVPAKYRRGKLIDPGEYEEGEVIKPAIYADGEVLEPEEYEEIPVTTPGTEAGEMYSLNYTECLCIEAAYHRRRADRSEARIAAIEEKLGL